MTAEPPSREEWAKKSYFEKRRFAVGLGMISNACPGCDRARFTAFGRSPGCLIHCGRCEKPTGPLTFWLLNWCCAPCWIKSQILRWKYRIEDAHRKISYRMLPLKTPACIFVGHLAGDGPKDGLTLQAKSGQHFYFAICKRCTTGFAIWL